MLRRNMAGCRSVKKYRSAPVRPAAVPAAIAVLGALAALAPAAWSDTTVSSRGPAQRVAAAPSPAEQACLAEAIYFEATPDAASRAAVAHVVVNRAEDPRFPRTVCGVVRDGCQFSYRCSGRSLALADPVKRKGAFATAEAALSGTDDPTNGALFFHSARVKPGGWFRSRPRVAEIGGNVFYR